MASRSATLYCDRGLSRLDLSSSSLPAVNVGKSDTLKLSFTVVDDESGEDAAGVQPHQAFLRFSASTGEEGIQPVKVSSSGKAKFELVRLLHLHTPTVGRVNSPSKFPPPSTPLERPKTPTRPPTNFRRLNPHRQPHPRLIHPHFLNPSSPQTDRPSFVPRGSSPRRDPLSPQAFVDPYVQR